ncbi:L,D-transpeptidase [Paenactinomyces guangxiensis]|uniref:L,D-transpeptidase n=1 Tax=Paenactinomyces guangxiensis TaxID=1490290 RepID=A0A7W2A8I5_9BACL|nr:L,D-transpeptidase [Paenactinomyces guangxiensis]MBA4493863.1 L,D-transpeptidase [Paenactinomyces guangxiensis]MBH8591329.1 L,D-transpeptidase [Paenactinomyces guangxiensis]
MYTILVRLSRRWLYLLKDSKVIKSYPVGIGKVATRTPEGDYTIINKVPYPYSYPGGPLSPFGTLWMGLSRPHYGIHGTNRPSSIGKMVSRGCIRMHNRDVEDLARYAGIGTSVKIRP